MALKASSEKRPAEEALAKERLRIESEKVMAQTKERMQDLTPATNKPWKTLRGQLKPTGKNKSTSNKYKRNSTKPANSGEKNTTKPEKSWTKFTETMPAKQQATKNDEFTSSLDR